MDQITMSKVTQHMGVTIDDCLKVLQSANKEEQYDKESISFEIKPLSDTAKGFGGEHFILTISYKTITNESKAQKFFLKNTDTENKFTAFMIESLNGYEKEAFLYDTFAKECATMGIDFSFAPAGYFTRPHFLVMEDISLGGFRTAHTHRQMDLGQCRSALDALAKFHMSIVIYEYEKRKINTSYSLAKERPEIVLERVERDGKMNLVERMVMGSMDGLLAIIDALSEEDVKSGIDKHVFKKRVKLFMENFYDTVTPKDGDLCCLLHNDLWINNIMFLYPPTADDENNSHDGATHIDVDPIDCKLIDFQILSYGCPAVDVMRTIYTNTRKELRDQHKVELLRHYYQRTIECLEKYGMDPTCLKNWSWEIFAASCERVELIVKMRCIAARSLTFLPQDVAAKWFHKPNGQELLLFTERAASMLESYTSKTPGGDLYRTIIGEDIRELWTMLS